MSDVSKRLTIEKLKEGTYATWAFQCRMLLVIEGVWDVVEEGVGESPSATVKKQDQRALAIVVLNVTDHIQSHLRSCKTAHEAWSKLAELYEKNGLPGLLALMQRFLNLRLDEDSMGAYIARVRELSNEFEATGHEMSETFMSLAAISGLPDRYATHKIVLTLGERTQKSSELVLADVFAALRQAEESVRQEANSLNPFGRGGPAAFAARFRISAERRRLDQEQGLCHNCGRAGHIAQDCHNPVPPSRMAPERWPSLLFAVVAARLFGFVLCYRLSTLR